MRRRELLCVSKKIADHYYNTVKKSMLQVKKGHYNMLRSTAEGRPDHDSFEAEEED